MVIIEGRTIGVSGCATTKRARASLFASQSQPRKPGGNPRGGTPDRPGALSGISVRARRAERRIVARVGGDRGPGGRVDGSDAPRDARVRCPHRGRGPRASPVGARAPRASARGARRRPPARREMGTADRPQSAAVSVGTARSRRAGTRAARRRTMRCKAKVDAACAASVRESLRKRRDAKWGVVANLLVQKRFVKRLYRCTFCRLKKVYLTWPPRRTGSRKTQCLA